MECLRCDKGIKTKLGFVTNSHRYCKNCFVHIIEKRLRKHLRQFHLKPKQRVVAKDALSRYFLEEVVHVPLQLLKRGKQSDVVVSLDTADDVAVVYLERLMGIDVGSVLKSHPLTPYQPPKSKRSHVAGGKKTLSSNTAENEVVLSLFHCLTDEELSLYCKYKKLQFVPKKSDMKHKLHKLEEQHPGTLHALQKSMVDLQGIF
jgi:hypothetical protein